MPISSVSFFRSTALFLLAGLVALMTIVGTTMWLVDQTQDYVDDIVRVRELRSAMVDLRLLVQQEDASQRGYLLTLNPDHLVVYHTASPQIEPALARLKQALLAYPNMSSAFANLAKLILSRHKDRAQGIALAKAGRRDEAIAMIARNMDDSATAVARGEFDQLILNADKRLEARIADQRSSADALRWVTIIGAIFIILVAGGAVFIVLSYTRELSKARAQVESLNAGLEERVQERTTDLMRANEEIQRFAYIVTHDLRAPLVNIMGFTSELEATLPPIQSVVGRAVEAGDPAARDAQIISDQELPEAIGFIRSSTRKMDGLINAILKISREGRRALKPEPIDLEVLLKTQTNAIQHQMSDAGGSVAIATGLPALVSDRMSLEQAFGNILDNAVKYRSPDRPLKIQIRARTAPGSRVVIEIEDNGRGIAPQDHERVFELFRRSGIQDKPGEGIGLAHVRTAIRNLGGDISVDSTFGRGTTFRINLPADLNTINRSPIT